MNPNKQFRLMQEEDLANIMSIERTAYEFSWTEGNFRDCLKAKYHCWIYQENSLIIGYGILSAAVGEGHVLNLCVRKESQRQGIGKKILQFLFDHAQSLKVEDLFLEVRASNKPAMQLYELMGFCEYGRRDNYYPANKGKEDAVLYSRAILI
jgi:[ribosomal protein S18]-alanine N-acetyltransferase